MPKINQAGVAHFALIILLLLGIVLGVFLVQTQTNLFPQAQMAGAKLYIKPATQEVGVGCIFSVDINLDTGGRATDGTDVVLQYNPGKINIVSIQNGDIYSNYPPYQIDNTNGKAKFSGLATPGQTYNGAGKFATVTLKTLITPLEGTEQVTLNFDFDPTNSTKTTDTNVVENGTVTDVLVYVENGTFMVGPESCNERPNPPGDVDGDGSVDYEDITELKRYMDISIASVQRADMDGDGKISMNDYDILYKIVLNNETEPGAKCLDNSQCSTNQVCDFNSSDCPRYERYCPPDGDCPQPICYGTCKEKSTKPTPTPFSQICGGIAGKECPDGYFCRKEGNYPDAAGTCVLTDPKKPAPSTPEPSPSPEPKIILRIEDVNGDGSVDFRDAVAVFGNLGQSGCGNKYDLNKDCRVTTSDITQVIRSYGR